jgi:hypothetical protein
VCDWENFQSAVSFWEPVRDHSREYFCIGIYCSRYIKHIYIYIYMYDMLYIMRFIAYVCLVSDSFRLGDFISPMCFHIILTLCEHFLEI